MATLIMTPSRSFGNSIPAIQAPYTSAIAPSMADSLPSLDFGFDELRERMAQFTARFDDFIAKGRKRVLEERNAFRMNVAEIEETQRNRKREISALESKSTSHASIIAREIAETEEMHAAIQSLTEQKEAQTTRRDELRSQISAVQSQIKQRRDAQAAYHRSLDAQARHNVPELKFWEHCLGLRIEGTGIEDQLRFVYLCVDDRDPDRECYFELQMGGAEYEVAVTRPRLDRDAIEDVQNKLNETRKLGGFLKGMRLLFMDVLKAQ